MGSTPQMDSLKWIDIPAKLMTKGTVTQSKPNIVTATAALTHTIRFRKRLNSLSARLTSLILTQRALMQSTYILQTSTET